MKYITTLNKALFENYGRKTLASWSRVLDGPIFLYIDPKEREFWNGLGLDMNIIDFNNDSLAVINRISDYEDGLGIDKSDFRFSSKRFSWKVMSIWQAANDDDSFTWIDADCILSDNFEVWWDQVYSKTHQISYFGRNYKKMHAETGLVYFNVRQSRCVIDHVFNAYSDLDLYNFKEWHDAYIFTSFIRDRRDCYDISDKFNLRSSNPILELDRGVRISHLKGNRKQTGFTFKDYISIKLGR